MCFALYKVHSVVHSGLNCTVLNIKLYIFVPIVHFSCTWCTILFIISIVHVYCVHFALLCPHIVYCTDFVHLYNFVVIPHNSIKKKNCCNDPSLISRKRKNQTSLPKIKYTWVIKFTQMLYKMFALRAYITFSTFIVASNSRSSSFVIFLPSFSTKNRPNNIIKVPSSTIISISYSTNLTYSLNVVQIKHFARLFLDQTYVQRKFKT